MRKFSQRGFSSIISLIVILVMFFGVLAASYLTKTGTRLGSKAAGHSLKWGYIANTLYNSKPIITTLFFAGPPNPNSVPFYTRHPQNPTQLDWSSDANISYAIGQAKSVGVNVLKVSYWGHQGETDQYGPTLLFSQYDWINRNQLLGESQITSLANNFFSIASQQQMLFAPLLEVSPAFPFYQDFPSKNINLIGRIEWLLKNFSQQPNWLQVYDKYGTPRKVIWLIETIHGSYIDPQIFAKGFDSVASEVKVDTGQIIGFIIDPTPLPPYGSTYGPDPNALMQASSILAIDPFDITHQGLSGNPEPTLTESDRLNYAVSVATKWSGSGLPFIDQYEPGYDGHIIFPGTGTYGLNSQWLGQQSSRLIPITHMGLDFTTWNGYTEGRALVPTLEDGNLINDWAKNIISTFVLTPTSSPTPVCLSKYSKCSSNSQCCSQTCAPSSTGSYCL